MDISTKHIQYKKQIGLYKGKPVMECATTGGFHIIVGIKNGAQHTFGTGSHRAIARHIARKREPELEITELSKADHVPVEAYAHLLPQYEALTDRFNGLEYKE
jgi:hypothetical protein